ncbi:MAG TPA: SDR family NAD(P)-dependent oxidoreductase [Polyangiaceae bacterium]|nr:SDR family NAD(P)-dependent oxidoreductase [Polyangiaceae bacterium]
MKKTIAVVGFGPGISSAVAHRFGSAGFAVALVGRNEERLAAGVKSLRAQGIDGGGFVADAGDPGAIRGAIAEARASLGPVHVIHWNAYGGPDVPDLLTVDPVSLRGVLDIAVVGLLTAVQEALPDLKSATDGAVLVTNGAFGEIDARVDQLAVLVKAAALALSNGAKHKFVGLLAERLKGEGVFVGEVMVAGTVKGTPWDRGQANLEAAAIADKFWELYQTRSNVRARVA